MIIQCHIGTMPTSQLQVKSKSKPLKLHVCFWGMSPEDYKEHYWDGARPALWKQYKVTAVCGSGNNIFYRVQEKTK